MWVCEEHVKVGVSILKSPHIRGNENKLKLKCLYCENEATYELYYFKVSNINARRESDERYCLYESST